uniref:Transposase n=1 Tax=Strongyloides papillosus TaxID=174720 RepID=A0A0N5C2P7_STREA
MILFPSYFSELLTEQLENDKETSVLLTTAKRVKRNRDLLNLIIRNIDNVRERKNIIKSCKAGKILCDSKKSYAESYKHGMWENCKPVIQRNKTSFVLATEILAMNIPHYHIIMSKESEVIRGEITMNRYKTKTLKIKDMPIGCFNLFKELDRFKDGKTVYFDVIKLNYILLGIFAGWKNLKHGTLIFVNTEVSSFKYKGSDRSLYSNENYTSSKSIKNIHLVSGTENVDWMANASRSSSHCELESLVLKGIFKGFLTADSMEFVASIVRYFKEIQFSLHYAGVSP